MGKAISQQHAAVVLRSRYDRPDVAPSAGRAPGTSQADGPHPKWPVRGELPRNS
jgi:hypothetical protein